MITVSNLVRVGARQLLAPASFRVGPGDRSAWSRRNGAGKTTLTKILAGEGHAGRRHGDELGRVGYLPQDPRTGDLEVLARDRILAARGLDAATGCSSWPSWWSPCSAWPSSTPGSS